MTEFWDSQGSEWRQTDRGSFVRVSDGELTATVFEHADGWGGVSNIFEFPRFTRRRRDTPEAAVELVIEAEGEGVSSALWASPSTTDWLPSRAKNGLPGFWCRRAGGVILAVRQCKPHPSGRYPPSWVASINAGEPVPAANSQPWFSSAEEAMMAAESEYERRASAQQQWR